MNRWSRAVAVASHSVRELTVRYPLAVASQSDGQEPAPEPGHALPEDVRAQLRAAAQSLAELVGGDVDRAEQALFESALELTRDATVLKYAPLLAILVVGDRRDHPLDGAERGAAVLAPAARTA